MTHPNFSYDYELRRVAGTCALSRLSGCLPFLNRISYTAVRCAEETHVVSSPRERPLNYEAASEDSGFIFWDPLLLNDVHWPLSKRYNNFISWRIDLSGTPCYFSGDWCRQAEKGTALTVDAVTQFQLHRWEMSAVSIRTSNLNNNVVQITETFHLLQSSLTFG